jgi:hypothetical protein
MCGIPLLLERIEMLFINVTDICTGDILHFLKRNFAEISSLYKLLNANLLHFVSMNKEIARV